MNAAAITDALARASRAGALGPEAGGNPRVGCAILAPDGHVLAVGHHRGAGTPHAEVDALAQLEPGAARGATVVVTLEPCDHTGHTGPCTRALLNAQVATVVYAVSDPNPIARGGAERLRAQGVRVLTAEEAGCDSRAIDDARDLTAAWRHVMRRERPWVIAKSAMSADGFVAAPDGTSQWITGTCSRTHAHATRASVDWIVIGMGTALTDNPALTARTESGEAARQPRPVVVGYRDLPRTHTLARRGALTLRTHDPVEVLRAAWADGARRVLFEGGPTLVSAALAAGVVDEWHAYRAPIVLGGGLPALAGLGVATLADAPVLAAVRTHTLGADQLTVYACSREADDVYRTR